MEIDFKNPTPLYRQIVEAIKSRIASGKLKVGDQIGSQQELARKYDVSLITVKKAMAELINEGVLFSRVGKGTYVAEQSPASNLSKHESIGLVFRNLRGPLFSLIIPSIEKVLSDYGFNILLANSDNQIEKEERLICHFRKIEVNGLIIASMTHVLHATSIIRKLHEEHFPYVVVSYIEDKDINYVGSDHKYGAFLATEHLIKLGYENIGYINGEEGNHLGELRKQGYQRALQQYGKSYHEEFIFRLRRGGEWDDYHSGYDIGKKFAQLSWKPDAMFIYNDVSALGFQKAILDQGLKIPEDVAIVGFDNVKRGRIANVPLTTVHQPTARIGELAAKSLIERIKGGKPQNRVLLKPELVIRDSCGAKVRTESKGFEKESRSF
ncbi:MAG: substrate-binding domain-containing protein [bacterium]